MSTREELRASFDAYLGVMKQSPLTYSTTELIMLWADETGASPRETVELSLILGTQEPASDSEVETMQLIESLQETCEEQATMLTASESLRRHLFIDRERQSRELIVMKMLLRKYLSDNNRVEFLQVLNVFDSCSEDDRADLLREYGVLPVTQSYTDPDKPIQIPEPCKMELIYREYFDGSVEHVLLIDDLPHDHYIVKLTAVDRDDGSPIRKTFQKGGWT